MSTRQTVTSVYQIHHLELHHSQCTTQVALPAVIETGTGLALFQETEELLEKWKHPDPYHAPTAPGGSKFERNLPAPILDPPKHMVM
ncbi:NADH dehydrogenase/NADH ubiquinone reductase (H(+)-translocating), partial [Scytalidium lignicola]